MQTEEYLSIGMALLGFVIRENVSAIGRVVHNQIRDTTIFRDFFFLGKRATNYLHTERHQGILSITSV